ncbi:MAG: hypothetical protein QNJ78_04725 [Gammaproteobacteria bacterium]|nr:hypothetical protein [Gammaproteobacteria bacterium]
MDKKILSWIISLTLIVLALAILLPGGREADQEPKLPWDIRVDPQGGSAVFGITLGESTLDDARRLFKSDGKVSLFVTQAGLPALEAYFERVFLSGLRADFVLVLEAEAETLWAMYDRGSRISPTTDKTRKVELAGEDSLLVGTLPIRLINYIPAADLDEALIAKRFGEPAKRISEPETGIIHWIYPEDGLSIGVNASGKELLQYIQPKEIEMLTDILGSDDVER